MVMIITIKLLTFAEKVVRLAQNVNKHNSSLIGAGQIKILWFLGGRMGRKKVVCGRPP